jgi:hypothetical protein
MTVKERLIKYINYKKISQSTFEKSVDLSNGYVNNIRKSIQPDKIQRIALRYSDLNTGWLLTGEGEMLKESVENAKKLIPFYDDAVSIGGINEQEADTHSITTPSEYIDAGDWFKDATAAIRHYGDSMVEYPSGCILALKEVQERQLIIWGRDYVIETEEYRITKRVQRGKNDEYIKAYSTNTETYPDGQLIHEPIDIAWENITKILLVLGYVVKKGGGTMVYNSKK